MNTWTVEFSGEVEVTAETKAQAQAKAELMLKKAFPPFTADWAVENVG